MAYNVKETECERMTATVPVKKSVLMQINNTDMRQTVKPFL